MQKHKLIELEKIIEESIGSLKEEVEVIGTDLHYETVGMGQSILPPRPQRKQVVVVVTIHFPIAHQVPTASGSSSGSNKDNNDGDNEDSHGSSSGDNGNGGDNDNNSGSSSDNDDGGADTASEQETNPLLDAIMNKVSNELSAAGIIDMGF
jgi:hypothetical protein